MPSEETRRRAMPLAARFGVTRVTDITGLDRVGIPVSSAIVPRSNDAIGVSNGKGLRQEDAMTGALMEAIERQAAIRARPPMITAATAELRKHENILEPERLLPRLGDNWSDQRRYEWVEGFDLVTEQAVWVPAGAAGLRWAHLGGGSPYRYNTSHGLASGNTLEEAVSQALCEWVERDSWTLADLAGYWKPRAIAEKLAGCNPENDFLDDLEFAPSIDLDGLTGPVEVLLRRFRRAGLEPMVRDITSDTSIPAVVAGVTEDDVPGFPQVHLGVGCHPDLRVAVSRALTEVAQSRCVDIQGVREDLSDAEGFGALGSTGVSHHTRRAKSIDRRRWQIVPSVRRRSWREIPSFQSNDIMQELRWMIAQLQRVGIRQIVAVDLSPADTGLSTVRVLVPGLEVWVLDHGRLGERAAAFWRKLMEPAEASYA